MPPDRSPEVTSADALRGRVVDLEGEVARLTLRVKDLQQQLWGRKAERGLGGTAALSLFAAVDATLPAALPGAVSAATPPAPSARRAGGPARPGPKPFDPATTSRRSRRRRGRLTRPPLHHP